MSGATPQGHIAVILAGGQSRRMCGRDKALVTLGGERLVDRVVHCLKPQCDRILVAAPHDYGTGLTPIRDAPDAPSGPAGGIYSVYKWLRSHEPGVTRFFTVPVDGPFLPEDLIRRLGERSRSAVASDGERDHPTFAAWRLDDLHAAWPQLTENPDVSLKALAKACKAGRVIWRDGTVFHNVNTPEELREAERRLGKG